MVTYKETKGGGVSGRCSECGRQSFDKSPKAVSGLKKLLEALKGGGDKGAGGGFDLTKL
jgi:hypothetical protein